MLDIIEDRLYLMCIYIEGNEGFHKLQMLFSGCMIDLDAAEVKNPLGDILNTRILCITETFLPRSVCQGIKVSLTAFFGRLTTLINTLGTGGA